VRFRPWPPLLTLPVSNIYSHSCRSLWRVKVLLCSPFGVQTRHGCVRGSHGRHRGRHRCRPMSLPLSEMVPMVAICSDSRCCLANEETTFDVLYMRLPPHQSRLDSSVGVHRTLWLGVQEVLGSNPGGPSSQ